MIESLQAVLSSLEVGLRGSCGAAGAIFAITAVVNAFTATNSVELSNGHALRAIAQVAIAALFLRIGGVI